MDLKYLEAAIEAVLFASGEPIEPERLAQALDADRQTVQKVLSIMAEKRENAGSGIEIIRVGGSYQLATKPEFAPYIRSALDMRRNMPLTPAAMEVLAVIAYNQPVTRGYIERVRGVDSSSIVANMEAKGLIEERGRMDIPGRPLLYGTTLDFLRCFGLESINDLPELPQELKLADQQDGIQDENSQTETIDMIKSSVETKN